MRWTWLAAGVAVAATACTSWAPEPRAAGSTAPPVPVTSRGARFQELLRNPLPTLAPFAAQAVDPVGSSVPVYEAPGGRVVRTFTHPQPSGAPLVFLLDRQQGPWLHVLLPTRPNGSSGWVRAKDVALRGLPYRVDVLRGEHVLRLYKGDDLVREMPIAVGTRETPTPGGRFYIKELFRPTNRGGFYGPYAFGLSGFSDVLERFETGEGVIGLHGTNDPGSIGRDVSKGCIRLTNADITYLARVLPLGTPVRVLA